jgi:hypothetical protein
MNEIPFYTAANLTPDPELRTTADGQYVVSLASPSRLAVISRVPGLMPPQPSLPRLSGEAKPRTSRGPCIRATESSSSVGWRRASTPRLKARAPARKCAGLRSSLTKLAHHSGGLRPLFSAVQASVQRRRRLLGKLRSEIRVRRYRFGSWPGRYLQPSKEQKDRNPNGSSCQGTLRSSTLTIHLPLLRRPIWGGGASPKKIMSRRRPWYWDGVL